MKIDNKKLLIILLILTASINIFAKGKKDISLVPEYFSLAEGYAEQKKYEKAVEFYKKAAVSPEYEHAAKYNLAKVYGLQNNWKQAADILKDLYKKVPKNKKIITAYAYSLAASGDEKEAFKIYEQIYLDDKENPESCFNYIHILIAVKKYDEALKLIDELKLKFLENTEQKRLDDLKVKIDSILNPPKKKEDTEKKPTDGKDKENKDEKKSEKKTEPAAKAKQQTANSGTEKQTEKSKPAK